MRIRSRQLVLSCFFALSFPGFSQSSYTITGENKNEDCSKGNAKVKIEGIQPTDTLKITWSTGQTDVDAIDDLKAGDYSAHVVIKSKIDTTINIKVEKEDCKIIASTHFTPNGDNYNDLWQIGFTELYPKFEMFVYNKWGQQVYSQRGTYTPWDGKWLGIDVPDGTYYYVFYYDPKNTNRHEKGDVTVLR